MLNSRNSDFAAVLTEVENRGAAAVPEFLTPEAERMLIAAVEHAAYERAEERVGNVYQDFDQLVIKLQAASSEPSLSSLVALADEYSAFLRAQAEALKREWLAYFAPTDVHVQRYHEGSRGITPHRDGRRFVKLVSIFSPYSPAEFRLCQDRSGAPLWNHLLSSGELLLLRSPGFAGSPPVGPLHSVSGPTRGVRYSISLRMEEREG